MCKVMEYYEDIARKEGLVKGREEGRAEGKFSQAFESAKLMLKAGKLQLSEVLSFFPVLTSQDVKRLQEEVTPA